jgi:hypothetical protein
MPAPKKNKPKLDETETRTKKKTPTQKKQSTLKENNSIPIPKAEQINIDRLILDALNRHKNEDFVNKKQKFKELTHLSVMCEEYLSAFMLVGYSLQNEPVVFFNSPTPKDEAALIDLLRSTFIDIVNNRP